MGKLSCLVLSHDKVTVQLYGLGLSQGTVSTVQCSAVH